MQTGRRSKRAAAVAIKETDIKEKEEEPVVEGGDPSPPKKARMGRGKARVNDENVETQPKRKGKGSAVRKDAAIEKKRAPKKNSARRAGQAKGRRVDSSPEPEEVEMEEDPPKSKKAPRSSAKGTKKAPPKRAAAKRRGAKAPSDSESDVNESCDGAIVEAMEEDSAEADEPEKEVAMEESPKSKKAPRKTAKTTKKAPPKRAATKRRGAESRPEDSDPEVNEDCDLPEDDEVVKGGKRGQKTAKKVAKPPAPKKPAKKPAERAKTPEPSEDPETSGSSEDELGKVKSEKSSKQETPRKKSNARSDPSPMKRPSRAARARKVVQKPVESENESESEPESENYSDSDDEDFVIGKGKDGKASSSEEEEELEEEDEDDSVSEGEPETPINESPVRKKIQRKPAARNFRRSPQPGVKGSSNVKITVPMRAKKVLQKIVWKPTMTPMQIEERLLKCARQVDEAEDEEGGEETGVKKEEKKENVERDNAIKKSFILSMLKQHEEVEEMDDSDSDDEPKAEVKNEKGAEIKEEVKEEDSDESGGPSGKKGGGRKGVKKPVRGKRGVKQEDAPKGKGRKAAKKTKGGKRAESSSEDEDEEDWEVVEQKQRDPNYKRPDTVTVHLTKEDMMPESSRLDMEQKMMRFLNRRRKRQALQGHKVHLLCLLALQRSLNRTLDNQDLKARAMSVIPEKLLKIEKTFTSRNLRDLLTYYKKTFSFEDEVDIMPRLLSTKIRAFYWTKKTDCRFVYLMGLLLVLRSLGLRGRLCMSHHVMSHRAVLLRRKDGEMVQVKPKIDDEHGPRLDDFFIEIFVPDKEVWRPIEESQLKVLDDHEEMNESLSQPVLYLIGIDDDGMMLDLSPKYNADWLNKTQKKRPDKTFLEDYLNKYQAGKNRKDLVEEKYEIENFHDQQGLPKTVSEYKGHPKYALERHLLKFEALYPAEPPVLGYCREEPVYPRDCVKLLRSADQWRRFGRQVKDGEKPYNVVTARPKWCRKTKSLIRDLPLEIFGEWQTEKYKPPVAKNGKVPRSQYGSVDLFTPDMMPIGCVQLKLPGLGKIADELGIDCAPAVIGFEGIRKACHAVTEGFIVCEEFKDILEEAWEERQTEGHLKKRERIRLRAIKNWRSIIKKVLYENRLKKKYKKNLEAENS